MRTVLFAPAIAVAAIVLAGCAGGPPPQQHHEEEWHAPVEILLRYVDKDGKLTIAELEAGLHKDFDAADLNHDGVLEPNEVRAVNEARWKEDQSAMSPLIDWKGNGLIDFDEFAATARALFHEYDRNGDGVLTPVELHPGRAAGPQNQSSGQEQQEEHRGGRRGGGGRGGGPQD
jgi:EF hand